MNSPNQSYPLISVIVPIYKVEKYLRRCIDSILAQTYHNLEVILVDDGSPDNCPAICDEYAKKDCRIRVLHKPNGGLSDARNKGVEVCKGELIGFVDSDDWIAPAMYEKLYTAMAEHNADLVICDFQHLFDDGKLNARTTMIWKKLHNETLTSSQAFAKMSEPNSTAFTSACNRLYRRRLCEKVKFPVGRIHEDSFTSHHFFGECRLIATIEDELYCYINRQESITTSKYSAKQLDKIDAGFDRYFYMREHGHPRFAASALVSNMRYILRAHLKLRDKAAKARLSAQTATFYREALKSPHFFILYGFKFFTDLLRTLLIKG